MDERTWEVMVSVKDFLDEAVDLARKGDSGDGPRLVEVVTEHFGSDAAQLPIVRLDVPKHQFVNLDIAVQAVIEQHGGSELIGVGGGEQRHHQTFGDLLQRHGRWGMPVGPVDRIRVETGPDSSREAVACGIHLFHYAGTPVAVYQRQGNPRYDSGTAIEVIAGGQVAEGLLSDVRRLMVELSVFRGQVLTFSLTDEMYGPSAGGIGFLERPRLERQDVVLPEGALHRVERHIVGAAHHREALRAAGQHLKRGLLLYGPPGTGKTHTVRYLIGQTPGVTTIVLAGNALAAVAQATDLAHALQPALIVMEDIDLIAEHRHLHGPQPLLFTLLDAMDGLSSEADVAFLLTSNRPDLLEAALSQRPGRVDLAVEIPRPDQAARRALLAVYAGDLPLTARVLDTAAEKTEGATASYFKELIRRSVLASADAGLDLTDEVLLQTLEELQGEAETLTRALLGADGPGVDPGSAEDGVHHTVLVGQTPEYLRGSPGAIED